MDITNLNSWLLAIIDIRHHNRRLDIFKKGNKAFDLVIEFMVANRLHYSKIKGN